MAAYHPSGMCVGIIISGTFINLIQLSLFNFTICLYVLQNNISCYINISFLFIIFAVKINTTWDTMQHKTHCEDTNYHIAKLLLSVIYFFNSWFQNVILIQTCYVKIWKITTLTTFILWFTQFYFHNMHQALWQTKEAFWLKLSHRHMIFRDDFKSHFNTFWFIELDSCVMLEL